MGVAIAGVLLAQNALELCFQSCSALLKVMVSELVAVVVNALSDWVEQGLRYGLLFGWA